MSQAITMRTESHLTPHDTYSIWLDSLPHGRIWFSYGDETVATDETNMTVIEWAVPITDNESGKKLLLCHEHVINAMEKLADTSVDLSLNQEDRNVIKAALTASDHEEATNEMCNFDAITTDAIVQVAVLGDVVYG